MRLSLLQKDLANAKSEEDKANLSIAIAALDSDLRRSMGEFGQIFSAMEGRRNPTYGFHMPFNHIDWPRVEADGFHGIEISPYLWKRRLEGGMWYYGWDCAAGVIWNKAAVHSVELIAKYDKKRDRIVEIKPL